MKRKSWLTEVGHLHHLIPSSMDRSFGIIYADISLSIIPNSCVHFIVSYSAEKNLHNNHNSYMRVLR